MLKHSGLPIATRQTIRFTTLKPRRSVKNLAQAVQAAGDLLAGEVIFLTLAGPLGTGKSHIAIALGWEWIEAGRVCRWRKAVEFYDEVKDLYKRAGDEGFSAMFARMCRIPLLILDDLGVEKPTEWVGERLDYLVDYRYGHELPTVLTVNGLITDLPERVQDRVTDRRLAKVILLNGPSYRQSES